MPHDTLLQLAGILVLGVLAQWTAWRLRLPSILLLLAMGVLAGPISGWLNPDKLFGNLMLPLVSLSVAVILYEGGLSLKFRELRHVGRAFIFLSTLGVAITCILATLAARYILQLSWPVAALLGAILVVTGPTVIGPILRHLRLRGRVGAILKWEGIIIDPVGATLALLVFTIVQSDALREAFNHAGFDLGLTVVAGVTSGVIGALVLIVALSRFWIPDSLHNPISLMLMFVAFAAANMIQQEAGLLAVTVMGIVLANQNRSPIRHIVEFKETLTLLLISCLFIVLAARLQRAHLVELGWRSFAYVAVLIAVVRPSSVLASTWRSGLSWSERWFLCFMAPRGIVAAAISSVFALSLANAGYAQAGEIVPVTFLVVFATVLFYGLAAGPLGRRLKLVQTNPQGILFVGAENWVRALAVALQEENCTVFLVDTDRENIRRCQMAGLTCLYGSALAEATREAIGYSGLGRMLALTSNNEVNSLACLRYTEDFGRQEVYQLPFATTKEGKHEPVPQEHRGRLLFGPEWNFSAIEEFAGEDPKVKKTRLTAEFDFGKFEAEHGDAVLPLFVIKPDGAIQIRTATEWQIPKPGDLIVSLVRQQRNR